MIEKKSADAKMERRFAFFIFAIFIIWCPIYLVVVRPKLNAAIAGYVSSYPAMLHLIPIIGPVVLLALLLGRKMPPKTS